MLASATSLGYAGSTDIVCLCSNSSFGYGVVDCAIQACPAGTDINGAIDWLTGYCSHGMSCSLIVLCFASRARPSENRANLVLTIVSDQYIIERVTYIGGKCCINATKCCIVECISHIGGKCRINTLKCCIIDCYSTNDVHNIYYYWRSHLPCLNKKQRAYIIHLHIPPLFQTRQLSHRC